MHLPLLLSLLFSSSTAFQCLQGTNQTSFPIDCNTFCYSEFGVSAKSVILLKRGCSREMKVHDKLLYLIKYQVMPEDRECDANGIVLLSPLDNRVRRERICCDYHKCNGLRKDMETASTSPVFLLTAVTAISLRLSL